MNTLIDLGYQMPIIPIADISKILPERRSESGSPDRQIKMRDGTTYGVGQYQIDDLMLRPLQLIPSEAGLSLIRVYVGDGIPPEVWREPVISWALCADGEVRVVTANGVNGGGGAIDGDYYVEFPGRSIQAVGQWSEPCEFADVNAMIAHYVAKAAKDGGAAS